MSDLFPEKTPSGLTLVSDHLPQATTKSWHFGWSLTVPVLETTCNLLNLHSPKKVTGFIKDGAYFCYYAYILCISRYLGFLWVVPTNTGIFLRGLKLCGENRT